jgi:hypothetical protein
MGRGAHGVAGPPRGHGAHGRVQVRHVFFFWLVNSSVRRAALGWKCAVWKGADTRGKWGGPMRG